MTQPLVVYPTASKTLRLQVGRSGGKLDLEVSWVVISYKWELWGSFKGSFKGFYRGF